MSGDMDSYGMELRAVVEALSPVASHVSVRGAGPGRFVFAEHQGRSVEVSRLEGGAVWVECWRRDLEAPVFDVTCPATADAIAEAVRWLCGA
jgi:hypothetical protein